MVLDFRGVAHPPPRRDGQRDNIADLTAAEIATTSLGRNGGTPMLVEHDHSKRIGVVHSSWEGRDGSLRVSGTIKDPAAEELVRSGSMRGLSLGTSVIQADNGAKVVSMQDELSICAEPRRRGCYIDSIGGKNVRRTVRASAHGVRTSRVSAASLAP